MQKILNILISGGAGYVGSHLSIFLLKKTNFNIFSIDNFSNSSPALIVTLKKKYKKNFFFEKIDIRNTKKLSNFFFKNNIDIVIHLAAKIEASESFVKKKEYKIINLDSTKELIKISIANKVKKFIFASSAAVYGNVASGYCSERRAVHPINPYGKYKLQVETYISQNKKKMSFAILRFFNIGGIEGIFYPFFYKRTSIFFLLVKFLLLDKKIFHINKSSICTKDNSPERDFIHVSDISKIIYHAALIKKNFILLNCGRGVRTSVVNLIKTLEHLSNKKIKTKLMKAKIGDPTSVISNSNYLNKYIKKIKFKNLNQIMKDCFYMSLFLKKLKTFK